MSKDKLAEKTIEAADKEQQELIRKQQELHKINIEERYEDKKRRQQQTEKLRSLDLDADNQERIDQIAENTINYLKMARNSKKFLSKDFDAKVPYFAKNLITIGATTGSGKSTTAANLAFAGIMQANQKGLIITNEEDEGDIYNRVTCLWKGWPYNDHTSFTDEQHEIFKKGIKLLSQRLTVIGDNFQGEMGQTTTIEGIEAIFNKLLQSKTKYDFIIIDYYQHISQSSQNPQMDSWKVQERLCKLLDSFKNAYTAPIIVLSQMRPGDDYYQERIEGRKMLANVSTCFLEIAADREKLATSWTIHKSRFTDAVGKTVWTGFDNGRYVPYDIDFELKIDRKNKEKQTREARKKIFMQKENEDEKES